jgi:hypothetical protein
MLHEHTKDLINRAVDRELSEPEKAEFNALLADSQEARSYSDGLTGLVSLLERVPLVEPPGNLQRRILNHIQLPRPQRWFTWSAAWMQGKPVSHGMAAAAGLMAAVAIYELGPVTDTDYAALVGTLARGEGLNGVVQLSYLDIDLPAVHGRVLLSGSDDLKLLRFDVASDAQVEFEVLLGGSGLTFGGFAQEAEAGTDNFSYSEGNLSVSNFGPQRFTVILRDVSAEAAESGGIVVSVSQEGEALYQGVLSL